MSSDLECKDKSSQPELVGVKGTEAGATTERENPSMDNFFVPGKNSWPELVGVKGTEAKATIERENPLVNAIIVEGPSISLDLVSNRVRVIVNKDGIVEQVPSIG